MDDLRLYKNTQWQPKKIVHYEFKKEAHRVNANTVFGVFLYYMELSAGDPMILMVASGTAVIVEDL